jgi:hypothetical protein
MEAGTARLRGRPHSMLRKRVVFDRAAAWTRLGVRVTRRAAPLVLLASSRDSVAQVAAVLPACRGY